MIIEKVPLSIIGRNDQLRTDAKYNIFSFKDDWKAFPDFDNHIPISDILMRMPIKKQKKGDLDKEAYLINIPDQVPSLGKLIINENSIVTTVGSDKTILTSCELMVSKLGTAKGYIYLNELKGKEVLGSSEFIPYKFKNSEYKKVLLYMLLTPELRKIYSYLETGKTPSHRRVNSYEFMKIKIPKLDNKTLDYLNKEIKKYEQKMSEVHSMIAPMRDVINQVFSETFDFDPKIYYEYGKGMTYGTKFSNEKKLKVTNIKYNNISQRPNLRLSVRVNNDVSYSILEIIEKIDTEILRKVVTEPISRGVTPKYSKTGEIPVIKTAHLTNYKIIDSNEFVTEEFYNKRKKAQIKKGDILLASTGKGSLGKVDIVTTNEKYVVDSHITIIRVDPEKYNSLFLVYWLRSVLGVYQIESEYTGATNQIELNDVDIEEFKIPNISLDEQQKIIDKISNEYGKQYGYKLEFNKLRRSIEQLIIDTVRE